MTGHELLKLREARVFRSPVMDTIINEFEPPADQFTLTDAFLPFKLVDKDIMIDLINHGAFGRTNPINLGADHKRISIPGASYKEHTAGHWREAVQFDEEVLAKAVNPQRPTERWGEGLATAALNLLDLRLNNLIEYSSSKLLINGTYSEARYGVNYTYDPKIPAKFYQDVTASPSWTTGGTWATAASAKPTSDIIGASHFAARNGIVADAVYMSVNTLEKYYNAADTQAMIKSSPALVSGSSNRKYIFDTLTGLKVVVDNRLYNEETRLTAASAANDTTLEVADASEFVANETVTLRDSLGNEEDATILSVSSNVITLTSGVANSYKIGDRVSVSKQYLPDDYVIIKGRNDSRTSPNNWISTPSLVKGASWTTPQPGRYTWTNFNDKVPYTLEVGAGIDGGPKISKCTWVRVKVA